MLASLGTYNNGHLEEIPRRNTKVYQMNYISDTYHNATGLTSTSSLLCPDRIYIDFTLPVVIPTITFQHLNLKRAENHYIYIYRLFILFSDEFLPIMIVW